MTPHEAVAQYVKQQVAESRFCVAYSGGLDSHALLVLMAQLQEKDSSLGLRAVHIDHGMQSESPGWAEHARHICAALNIPLIVRKVEEINTADGPEAGARMARYAEFSAVLQKGEHLLLAQHAEDQAETFLLQALRGSGPDGLAGIPRKRRFASGFMGRPVLACSQESLQAFAREEKLDWIEDPSNQNLRYDRNYLRHKILPLLKARWPAAAHTLSRSAVRSGAASQTLLGLSQQDLEGLKISGTSELSIEKLKALPRERAFAALRLFVRERGLRMPRLQDLVQVMSDLIDARSDSNGVVNVRDYLFRRHRDSLYLLLHDADPLPFLHHWPAPFEALLIPETGLTITRELCAEQGIRMPEAGVITIKSRAGGELIKLGEPTFHKAVKKVLQESAIPPWLRESIPLLYVDERLAAIWNIVVAVDCKLPDNSLQTGAQPDRPAEESSELTDFADISAATVVKTSSNVHSGTNP